MYTIDKSFPKKTNRRIYYNREYGSESITAYSILTYDKTARSFDDPLETRKYRSVITTFPENYTLSFSPPSSTSLELFQETHPCPNNNNIQISEIIEGILVHFFYDYRLSQWEIATKNAIGGNYHIFNKKHKKPLNKEYPTVREMFLECLRFPRCADFKDVGLFDYLSKEHSYCFVMRHPKNPIVLDIETPELFLVSVYESSPYQSVLIPQSVFQSWECFKDISVIRFPRLYSNDMNYSEYKTLSIKSHIPGITFLDLGSGERCNIINPIYENTCDSDILYQYLCLRRINKVNEFLSAFPNYTDAFLKFREDYKAFVEKIHRGYISTYVAKTNLSENVLTNYIYNRLHRLYLKNKTPITKKIIYEFLEESFSPDEILYSSWGTTPFNL